MGVFNAVLALIRAYVIQQLTIRVLNDLATAGALEPGDKAAIDALIDTYEDATG